MLRLFFCFPYALIFSGFIMNFGKVIRASLKLHANSKEILKKNKKIKLVASHYFYYFVKHMHTIDRDFLHKNNYIFIQKKAF